MLYLCWYNKKINTYKIRVQLSRQPIFMIVSLVLRDNMVLIIINDIIFSLPHTKSQDHCGLLFNYKGVSFYFCLLTD